MPFGAQQLPAGVERQAKVAAAQAPTAQQVMELERMRYPLLLNPANYATAFEGLLLLLAIYQ